VWRARNVDHHVLAATRMNQPSNHRLERAVKVQRWRATSALRYFCARVALEAYAAGRSTSSLSAVASFPFFPALMIIAVTGKCEGDF